MSATFVESDKVASRFRFITDVNGPGPHSLYTSEQQQFKMQLH